MTARTILTSPQCPSADTIGNHAGNAVEWVGDQDIGSHLARGGAAVGAAAGTVAAGAGNVIGSAGDIIGNAGDAIGSVAEGAGEAIGGVVNEDCCKQMCQLVEGLVKEIEKMF